MHSLWARSVTPLIVGGSSFYLQSIFFPPISETYSETCTKTFAQETLDKELKALSNEQLWHYLYELDPERAKAVHPQDRYRIERALQLFAQGKKPSLLVPRFEPPGTCAFYFLTREKDDLYKRINERVDAMLAQGWLDEVKKLDTDWKNFLVRKKLIGYPELIEFLNNAQSLQGDAYTHELKGVADQIKSKTRVYAKRQLTFWRMLKKKLQASDPKGAYLKKIEELNLTISPLDLYLEKTCDDLQHLKAT